MNLQLIIDNRTRIKQKFETVHIEALEKEARQGRKGNYEEPVICLWFTDMEQLEIMNNNGTDLKDFKKCRQVCYKRNILSFITWNKARFYNNYKQ
jgi:hypothetical protein